MQQNPEAQRQQEESRKQQVEDMKNGILSQVLSQEARTRRKSKLN